MNYQGGLVRTSRLNFAAFAGGSTAPSRFQNTASTDADQEVIFGLVGSWGSRKTSLLNMVGEALEEDFEDIVVLSFNPWLFSGVDHLFGVFFEELAAQPLEQRPGEWSKKAGRALQTYGKILGELRAIPAIGYWATLLGKVSEFAGRQSNSTLERASVGCWDDARTLHKAGKR